MEFKIIKFNSKQYQQELNLRNQILRIPLGMDIKNEDISPEISQIHFGAFKDNKLLSCLIIKPIDEFTVQLRQMAVDKDYQNHGIGKKLVLFAQNYIKNQKISKIILHSRKTAIGFYKKLGFSTQGKEFIEVGIPHILMKKII